MQRKGFLWQHACGLLFHILPVLLSTWSNVSTDGSWHLQCVWIAVQRLSIQGNMHWGLKDT